VRSNLRTLALARVSGFLLCCALGVSHADTAQTLTPPFTDAHTIAAANAPVPVEHDFNITATGAYQVVLTDLGAELTPAIPLSSVTMAVTTGNTLVGQALTVAGTLKFNATTTGTYTVHVVGVPGSGGVGVVGLQVGTVANPTSINSFSDNIQAPSTLPAGTAILDDSFTVTNSGSYTLSLIDVGLPQNLSNLQLALSIVGGGLVTTFPNAMQATVPLTSGTTYKITAIGVAGTANAGLFSAVVTPQGGGAPVYAKAIPVGATFQIGAPTLTAGNHTITLADLAFPAALSQVGAAVLFNGQSVTASPLAAAGTQSFSATAGAYEVFAIAVPQSTAPAAGAYSLQIQPTGGAAEFSVARVVTGSGSNLSGYSFDSTLQSAGSFTVQLTDFTFPVALNAVRVAAVQNGAVVGTPLTTAGNLNMNAQAGAVTYLVIAQADPTHGGLFDLNVTASGSSTLLFDATQGVGAGFISRKVNVTSAGTYGISSSDLGFPTSFGNLAMIVTQGANNLGSVFSLGNVTLTNAAAGNYFINLIAQPSTTAGAGTYALVMAQAPTLSLTPSATSVNSGGSVTLTWSAQNATSCTAKNGWTGTQQVQGTFQTPALTTNTVFTLSCTGPGGTTSQSVTITVNTSPPAKSGGGGGSIDETVVLGLATLLARRLLARRKQTAA